MEMTLDRIVNLSERIADLKKRWPAHSVPPAMMAQLDELEEDLATEFNMRSEIERFQFKAIGYVVNAFQEPASQDILSASPSRIILAPDLLDGLSGLKPGMMVWVVYVFHRSVGYHLLQHPRGDQNRPMRGVFALRSPNRPNPIGVTEVEIAMVEGNILTVRGLDAIHGTPVLDLKMV